MTLNKEQIKCDYCRCNIKGKCFRFPPTPHLAAQHWDVKRPDIRYDSDGCFAGILKVGWTTGVEEPNNDRT